VDQVVQVIGALMILVAYGAAQTGRWTTDNPLYLWLNLVGSIILAVLAAMTENWGFLLLEGVWAIVTARSLLQRRGPAAAPPQPPA
jgi:membrane-bound ClpP family serine protease